MRPIKTIKNSKKIEIILFYLMLIFSCIAYVGYYIYSKQNGIPLLISYSRSSQQMMEASNMASVVVRFVKDGSAVLLLIVEALSMNRTYRANVFVVMAGIVSYGTIVALFNGAGVYVLLSGYRMVLYFTVLLMFFCKKDEKYLSVKTLLRIITYLLSINTIIACSQAFDCVGFRLNLIGQGSYRFMGLFPAAAAYAYFCLGASLFAFCVELDTLRYHRYCILIFVVAFIGCYVSGTRSSMINMLFVVYMYFMEHTHIEKSQKLALSVVLIVPTLVFVVNFSNGIANRGSIMENALSGGRISIFLNTFLEQSVLHVAFGNGIGTGSNSAATLSSLAQANSGTIILDGTLTTVLYQFGLCGFMLCLCLIWKIYRNVNMARGFLNAVLFTFTILLQCFTCNILEAYALLIMLFVCYYALIRGDKIFYIE